MPLLPIWTDVLNCRLSKSDAQVVFTYIGYVDVTARATDNMVVTMKEDRNELNEIVVVGYGTQKR